METELSRAATQAAERQVPALSARALTAPAALTVQALTAPAALTVQALTAPAALRSFARALR
ncbi:hypothetical protein KCW65_28625, partial [Mycobacterium tuberculosis]|nr:hypothetical protein [Mycobacterium tuberculosis]